MPKQASRVTEAKAVAAMKQISVLQEFRELTEKMLKTCQQALPETDSHLQRLAALVNSWLQDITGDLVKSPSGDKPAPRYVGRPGLRHKSFKVLSLIQAKEGLSYRYIAEKVYGSGDLVNQHRVRSLAYILRNQGLIRPIPGTTGLWKATGKSAAQVFES